MLENINIIRDLTKSGPTAYLNVIDMSESTALPLSNLGIISCSTVCIKNHYKLIRRGSESGDSICIYLIDGEVEFETGSRIYKVKPGSFMYYPTSTPRRIELVKGDRYTQFMFHIGPHSPFKSREIIVNKSELMPQMLEAFKGYISEATFRKPEYFKAASAFANLLTAYLAREIHSVNSPAKSPMDSAMEKLWDAIRLHPHEDWSIGKMASFVHSSTSNFSRMVKKQTGLSPNKYLVDIRMEKAKLLIENGYYSLKDISDAVGYSSVYAFSNTFLRHVGVRPGAYRRKPTPASK